MHQDDRARRRPGAAPPGGALRLALWGALGMALAALLILDSAARDTALELLAGLGSVHLAPFQSPEPGGVGSGSSEYLVVLSGEVGEAVYSAFFEEHPGIVYLSQSIYPNTLRVALPIPVGDAVATLEAQPFVGFVIKNYPFLFCH